MHKSKVTVNYYLGQFSVLFSIKLLLALSAAIFSQENREKDLRFYRPAIRHYVILLNNAA
jgi:hypothetical protein